MISGVGSTEPPRSGGVGFAGAGAGITVLAPASEEVLSREALDFVRRLHRELNPERERLLARRHEREGQRPGFLEETRQLREGDWRVT